MSNVITAVTSLEECGFNAAYFHTISTSCKNVGDLEWLTELEWVTNACCQQLYWIYDQE